MLTTSQALILLAVDDQTGKLASYGLYLGYGLAATMLTDLWLQGAVTLEKDSWKKSTAFTASMPSQKTALDLLFKKKEILNSHDALYALAMGQDTLQQALFEECIQAGWLKREQNKILWVFNSTRYPEKDGSAEKFYRAQLNRVIDGVQKASLIEYSLLLTLKNTYLLKTIKHPIKTPKEINQKVNAVLESPQLPAEQQQLFNTLQKTIQQHLMLIMASTIF